MPLRTGIWGDDPNSDLAVLVDKISTGGFVSRHPNLVPSLDIKGHSPLKIGERLSRLQVKSALPLDSTILLKLVPELAQKPALKANTLVIQVDSYSAMQDSAKHAPPPLNYYRYILETRYWQNVTLVNLGKDDNPVSTLLLKEYPKIKHFTGNLVQKWRLIAHANHLAIGCSRLAHHLSQLGLASQRVWFPSYAHPKVEPSASVLPIEITDYFTPHSWTARSAQIAKVISHPAQHIIDNNRWTFTETERCRSFEFCQSCRDTGATGTLWRKVIASRFDVPNTDWECPHGWKWGGKPGLTLALQRGLKLGSAIKKTTSALGVVPCKDCVDRGQRWDGTRK